MTHKTIPLTQGKEAIVDVEDLDTLSQYKWYAMKIGQTYYAARYDSKRRRNVFMHRELMGFPKMVDHKDGNGLNNTRSNMRASDSCGNNRNRRKREGCTSGYKGVCWDAFNTRWRADICSSGTKIYLGSSKSEKECASMYDRAAQLCFGEFAQLNNA